MQTYFGTKCIVARPMDRQAYNDYRGWELPSDEDGSDEGMLGISTEKSEVLL